MILSDNHLPADLSLRRISRKVGVRGEEVSLEWSSLSGMGRRALIIDDATESPIPPPTLYTSSVLFNKLSTCNKSQKKENERGMSEI